MIPEQIQNHVCYSRRPNFVDTDMGTKSLSYSLTAHPVEGAPTTKTVKSSLPLWKLRDQ